MDVDQARVVVPETDRCLLPVKPRMTETGEWRPKQLVNIGTLAMERSGPADLKKDANGFALPITLRLLVGSGQVRFDQPGN